MTEKIFDKNTLAKENLFGWYPLNETPINQDPQDIYINLGSRHPRPESYKEFNILKQHHVENKKHNLKYFQKKEIDLTPPWALHVQNTLNQEIQDEAKKTKRSKSAPVSKICKSNKKQILCIPQPQLNSLFNRDLENNLKYQSIKSQNCTQVDNNEINKIDQEAGIDAEKIAPFTVEVQNLGKKPIIKHHKNRPKTVGNFKILKQNFSKERINSSFSTEVKLSTDSVKSQFIDNIFIDRAKIQNLDSTSYLKKMKKNSAKNNHSLGLSNHVLESWKIDLLERSINLEKRPSYFVKIDLEKLKPDRAATEVHYNAPETFFYNTLPYKKRTFTIDPNFISESLNVQNIELKLKQRSSSIGPVKYRREFAFVY